ncbi:MAG: hypothetical protein ACRDPT_08790 [Streptomycetales bacterium]
MMSYSSLVAAQPGRCTEAAAAFRRVKTHLDDFNSALGAQVTGPLNGSEAWTGTAQQSAMAARSVQRSKVDDAAGQMGDAGKALDDLAAALTQAKEFVRRAEETAAQHQLTINDTGTVTAPPMPGPPDPVRETRRREAADETRQLISKAVEHAQDADEHCATKLTGVLDASGRTLATPFKWGEFTAGLLLGVGEGYSQRVSNTLTYLRRAHWRRGTWVSGHTRQLASGRVGHWRGHWRRGGPVSAHRVADAAGRPRWAGRARILGHTGTVVSFATAGVGQWISDSHNPNLETSERIGRAAMQSVTVGGGAWAGAAAGAAIGSVIPGVGTVVGGVVGGIIGGMAGGELADAINDGMVDMAGDGAEAVGDALGGVADRAGEVIDDITPW